MTNSMSVLLVVFGFGFFSIMGLLCTMLLFKMWTNQINLSTLLKEANGDASMSRFQLLIFTLVVAVGVFLSILHTLTLPDIPNSVLILLGISASTYATGKAITFTRPEGLIRQRSNPPPTSPPPPANPSQEPR